MLDSRTYRSIARALDGIFEQAYAVTGVAVEFDSSVYSVIAMRGEAELDQRGTEYVVRTVRVMHDELDVNDPTDHTVHIGGGIYCVSSARAWDVHDEAVRRHVERAS